MSQSVTTALTRERSAQLPIGPSSTASFSLQQSLRFSRAARRFQTDLLSSAIRVTRLPASTAYIGLPADRVQTSDLSPTLHRSLSAKFAALIMTRRGTARSRYSSIPWRSVSRPPPALIRTTERSNYSYSGSATAGELHDVRPYSMSFSSHSLALTPRCPGKHYSAQISPTRPQLVTAYNAVAGHRGKPDYGAWLYDQRFTATLPRGRRWFIDVHDLRQESYLSHPSRRRRGRPSTPTRPIDWPEINGLMLRAATAYGELLTACKALI